MLRTSGEATKQYSNLKQRAKGKLSEIKRPKTGGGPKPVSPSASEKAILENLEGRPSLEGLSGGIDTSALSEPVSEVVTREEITKEKTMEKGREENKDTGTSKSLRKRKMNIQELEMENLRLENTKLQKEIKKMEVETEVLQIKKNFYDVKLQVIFNEHPEVVAQMLKDNEC